MSRTKLSRLLIILGSLLIISGGYMLLASSQNPSKSRLIEQFNGPEGNNALAAISRNDQDDQTPNEWAKPGDEWRLKVRIYNPQLTGLRFDPKRIPEVHHQWEMRVNVLQPRVVAGKRIARFQFTPVTNVPESRRQELLKYILEIDAQTGKVEGIQPEPKLQSIFTTAGEMKFIITAVWGFPVDWIADRSDWARIPLKREVKVEYYGLNKQFKVEKFLDPVKVPLKGSAGEVLQKPGVQIYLMDHSLTDRVVQTWIPGERWWRSFQRFSDDGEGHKELRMDAVLVEK